MVIRYMLDTNACIALIKARPEAMFARLSGLSVEEVAISSIVAAELWYGVARSQKKKKNEAALRDFFDYVTVLDWPDDACSIYGRGFVQPLKRRALPLAPWTSSLLLMPYGLMPSL